MRQHWISTEQEQRMDVLGELKPSTKHIWIGLHGYGQLVEFFQRTFRDLATEDRVFVFPQAPHKFYINGVSGRVGASWMTKDERLKDIDNQKKYLTTVINWAHAKAPSTPIHVLAFSQGVATIMRFLGHSPARISTLLAWAGSWPSDASEENIKALSKINFQGWFGDEDEFISRQKQIEIQAHYKDKFELDLAVSLYKGGHKFDKVILKSEIERLEQTTL